MANIEVPENKWLKGQYVKEKGIKQVTMIGDEPKGSVGDFGYKVEAEVTYDGKTSEDPNTISWNATSAKILVKVLGKDSKSWLQKPIPIEPSRTEKGYAIYVDESQLVKMYGAKQDTL